MAGHLRSDRVLSRRQWLQVGSVFGLTLPHLLWARSVQASQPARRRSEKSCIFIVLSGGLSHIDTFDPKPDAPLEIRGAYRTIPTRTPGVRLTEMFPRLAQCSNRYCLVRSMSHDDTVHVTAAHTMLTGQPDGRSSNDSPMMGSLVSRLRPSTSNMPSHVWLHNMKTGTNKVPKYNSGLSRLGFSHAPFRVGHELDNPNSPGFRMAAFDPPADVPLDRQNDRFRLLERVSTHPNPDATASYQTFQQRARQLVTGPSARQAFELDREPDRVRDRYGRHPLGQYTLMARRLIEAGVRMVTVTGWPGLAPGETQPTITQVWDMHGDRYANGDNMYGNGPFGMKWSLPRLDQAVSALIEDLHTRGMLDDTLIIVCGEFGRTPLFENRGKGRGHWPHCYTSLLAGGGLRSDCVYGASDSRGAYVSGGQPISHLDFGATLYHALGITPETRYGPDGFTYRVSDGQPVLELFQ